MNNGHTAGAFPIVESKNDDKGLGKDRISSTSLTVQM